MFAGGLEFEEDRLVCERVWFDFATIMRQLGVLPPDQPADDQLLQRWAPTATTLHSRVRRPGLQCRVVGAARRAALTQ